MRSIILIILSVSLFSSCATISSSSHYNVFVKSDKQNSRAEIQGNVYDLPAKVWIKHSKKDLSVNLKYDSISENFTIKSSLNGAFLLGNLVWVPAAPVAYLIDLTNERRFHYGDRIFLKTQKKTRIIKPCFVYDYFTERLHSEKGQVNLVLSFPWVNSFYFHSNRKNPKSLTGYMGLSSGVEYFYEDSKYLALNASALVGFPFPFPAPLDHPDEYSSNSSVYVSLTDNINFGRVALGYGINYSVNNWSYQTIGKHSSQTNKAIGSTLTAQHRFNEFLHLGLTYRPTFFVIQPDFAFEYEHLISFELGIRVRLTRHKSKTYY